MSFENVYTFTYQKTSLYTLLLLVLKTVKAFIVSLRNCNDKNEYWKVKRVLRYHVSNRCKFAEKYAHYLVFLIYLFRIKGELLGGPNLSYEAS